ncbi:MAG: MBOAT family O-acyltransferase, partial [Bacteroidia bacterium]
DMPELWRRWHISLTSWFQDYVYFPLGGSRGSKWFRVRNTFIVFILSGLWHGANLTFIFWGFIFAVYLLPNLLTDGKKVKSKIVAEGKFLPSFLEVFEMLRTFLLVVFITVFFRVKNISQGFDYLSRMFSKSLIDSPEVLPQKLILFIGFMILIEWLHRTKKHGLELSTSLSSPAKWGIYYGMVILIIFFGGTQQDFIYFQF